jgi:hypothetical protein
MELTIQKSFEETIKIETPKYFKSTFTGRLSKLSETGLLKVSDALIVYSEYNPKSRYFHNDVIELLDEKENIEISEKEFESTFADVLVRLQMKAYE